MNTARTAASRVGGFLLVTSLLCIVLILAVWIAGPALAFAIFSAILILSPLAWTPRQPAPVPLTARRRRFAARAPPLF
jgi:hypothetical protein